MWAKVEFSLSLLTGVYSHGTEPEDPVVVNKLHRFKSDGNKSKS